MATIQLVHVGRTWLRVVVSGSHLEDAADAAATTFAATEYPAQTRLDLGLDLHDALLWGSISNGWPPNRSGSWARSGPASNIKDWHAKPASPNAFADFTFVLEFR